MAVGDVTYTDFLGGRVTFTEIAGRKVRMSGQLNGGLELVTGSVVIEVRGQEGKDLVKDLDSGLKSPGTRPFECEYLNATIDDFTGVPILARDDNGPISISDPTETPS
ncbi:hypothetical protein [Streptomyces venezuelae]|uniref:hypothetical protein n=1 Tax=Streptomyces venezuelae TaxID=54571 RepID=UPI0037D971CC